MSEGTKLGEFKESTEFNTAVQAEEEVKKEESLEATQRESEEVSDLEKQLLEEVESQKKEDSSSDSSEFDNMFEEAMSKPLLEYQEGDVVDATVRSVEKSGVLVDFGYKSDGYVMNNETTEEENAETLNAGDPVTVLIEKLETKEGYAVLSIRKASVAKVWNNIMAYAKEKKIVSVKVTSKVQGGLVAAYQGIKGFIPASQLLKDRGEDLEEYLGQTLEAAVLQADRRRKKVIFSHKIAASKKIKEESLKLLDEIEVGEVREGKVTSVKDFGVFVDIGGVEGLVHISELSWSRVMHPSDHVAVGDEVKVFILGIDKENNRISLGMKQLEPDPWVEVAQRYQVGQVVKGKISRTVPFGAFIEIENNLEGLIHISELSDKHVEKPEDVIGLGQEVEAKIIKLIPEEQKIGLSVKRVGRDDDEEQKPKKRDNRQQHNYFEDEALISPIAEAFNEAERLEQERNEKEGAKG